LFFTAPGVFLWEPHFVNMTLRLDFDRSSYKICRVRHFLCASDGRKMEKNGACVLKYAGSAKMAAAHFYGQA
jgi:hypothetical protein